MDTFVFIFHYYRGVGEESYIMILYDIVDVLFSFVTPTAMKKPAVQDTSMFSLSNTTNSECGVCKAQS